MTTKNSVEKLIAEWRERGEKASIAAKEAGVMSLTITQRGRDIAMKRLLVLSLLLCGCAVRKPAIRPGHDQEHPALTPLGKATCKTGLLKLFGSYGPRNCKNAKP
jgi:hypothetical protein